MDFAILARCRTTGQLGIGLASSSLASGNTLDAAIRPSAGAVLIFGKGSNPLNRLSTNLLALGHNAKYVLQAVRSNQDDTPRHIMIVDRDSSIHVHYDDAYEPACDLEIGDGFAVICEAIAANRAAETMAKVFDSGLGLDFDERMLQALEAGAQEVARTTTDSRPRSAALLVWGQRDYSDIDLRVDLHNDPVKELRRIFSDFKPTAAYYEERARNPSQAINALEFAGVLVAQREKDK